MLELNAEGNYEIMAQVDEVKTNTFLIQPKKSDGKVTCRPNILYAKLEVSPKASLPPYYIHWKKTYTAHA